MGDETKNNIAFVWDNFGPMHVDRCEALGLSGVSQGIVGIELFGRSDTYNWVPEHGTTFVKHTLYQTENWDSISAFKLANAIVKKCESENCKHVFLCNYDRMGVFIAALKLRLKGYKVYVMGCSKFDDKPRQAAKEVIKSFFLKPYQGAIGSGERSKDYFRYLGINADNIHGEYNTLSVDRIRKLSGNKPAPDGVPYDKRHFTIVARLVPKKNIHVALDAFADFLAQTQHPRQLNLCGSGPLEKELRTKADDLGIAGHVNFHGFVQTQEIAKILGNTLALLLPSVEEQFGNVVIEAQAMGLPVILSDNCGARDHLVRSGVNGFVMEPDNPKGMANFMLQLSENEAVWTEFAKSALEFGMRGDVSNFVSATQKVIAH